MCGMGYERSCAFRYGTKFDTITMTLWTPLSFQHNFHFTPKRGHFILTINIFCIWLKGFLHLCWNETKIAFFVQSTKTTKNWGTLVPNITLKLVWKTLTSIDLTFDSALFTPFIGSFISWVSNITWFAALARNYRKFKCFNVNVEMNV